MKTGSFTTSFLYIHVHSHFQDYGRKLKQMKIHSLKLTYPLKIGYPKKQQFIFQALIFRAKLAVSFRDGKSSASTLNLQPQEWYE